MSVLQPEVAAPGALAPVEAALDELQRRICRLVLEALLLELQVRLPLASELGWKGVCVCKRFSEGSFRVLGTWVSIFPCAF